MRAEKRECLFLYSKKLFLTLVSIVGIWLQSGTKSKFCNRYGLDGDSGSGLLALTGCWPGQAVRGIGLQGFSGLYATLPKRLMRRKPASRFFEG
ncbi:hypothetical protein [Polaromonas hydrogenivorans]|uniref:Uncharacterized protein n=1 Tax=Polaromonas hydrogenivorans TaxID=335476 RepID=A0AAU7LVX0_9BURK